MSVEIKGIDKLIVKLDSAKNIDLTKALTKACIIVETSAKEKVPVDTGDLKRSITWEIDGNTGIVGTNKEYAPYVEFGTGLYAVAGNGRQTPWKYQTADGKWHTTSGQKAQPYLQPALNENRERIKRVITESVVEEINNAGR